jgi:glucose-1-phosphate thymidylyltransferase
MRRKKMKCIILCAGYATRLYPLTKNTPKHLLKIGDKAILDYIIEKLPINEIDHIYLITNNKFYQNFVAWKKQLTNHLPITVINDNTMSNDDRLGSMGDTKYVVDQAKLNDDFLLMSGDNLFNFEIAPMLKPFFEGKNVIALYDVKTKEEARKMGIPTLDAEGVITELVEKPVNPKSTLSSIGIYFFHKEVIDLLQKYIHDGNSTDKVGEFISWLCKVTKLYTYKFDSPNDIWLDIGTPSQLELAEKLFKKQI